jgi:hypothetical protein
MITEPSVPVSKPRVITPDPISPEPVIPNPVEVVVPAFFYFDGNKPTMLDTGRTGFMAAYMEAAKNLVVVSDDRETDDHPVVYFYGIEDIACVEVHFDREADFPRGFAIYREGLPPVTGGLSEYDEETETFSLELRCVADFEMYPGLVLNKSLFDAYPDQGDMTESQYRRAKNILTSLALWASIAYQTADTAPAVAGVRDASGAYLMLASKSAIQTIAKVLYVVAIIAAVVVVIACPPAALAMSSAGIVLVPIVTPLQVAAVTVSIVTMVGAVILEEIASNMPDEPPPVTINTGDPGPAGGVLLGKLEGTDQWVEVAPHDIGRFRMFDGAAAKACEAYSVTVGGTKIGGWFLPDSGTLQSVYVNLYKEGKINCEPDVYWSSTLNGDGNSDYIAINFYNGRVIAADSWSPCLVLPVRHVSEAELLVSRQQ